MTRIANPSSAALNAVRTLAERQPASSITDAQLQGLATGKGLDLASLQAARSALVEEAAVASAGAGDRSKALRQATDDVGSPAAFQGIGAAGGSSIYAHMLQGDHLGVKGTGISRIAGQHAPELTNQLTASVDRFLGHYNPDGNFIPTDIDARGEVTSNTLGIVNQSRHIYGLAKAYELTGEARYLDFARKMADSYVARFVDRSIDPPGFHENVDWDPTSKTSTPRSADALTVNHQSYGLAGLVALYKVTRDPELLATIRELHQGFVKRFHDDEKGGFYDSSSRASGQPDGLKSYNSTVYVATSYLQELAQLDTGPGHPDTPPFSYSGLMRELTDLILEHFLDPKTGFLVENFDRDWNPAWRSWQSQEVDGQTFSISIVGHNTQTAWLLLEQFELTGDPRLKDAAVGILSSMLERGIDWENGGAYNAAKREAPTDQRWMWGTNKAWWQQAETLQAFLLADKLGVLDDVRSPQGTGREALEKTLSFWNHFVAPAGGEHGEVTETGQPVDGPLSGFGKATYHMAQLASTTADYARRAKAGPGGRGLAPQEAGRALGEGQGLARMNQLASDVVRGMREGQSPAQLQRSLDELQGLHGINHPDNLGLTLPMRAAALGRLDVLQALTERGGDLALVNAGTGANLLHYAAQATEGGADVVRWILDQRPDLLPHLNDRMPSNGHTVAQEAVFNANAGVVDVLLDLRAKGHDVDFSSPTVFGWTPRTFAEREHMGFADRIPEGPIPVAERGAWMAAENQAWLEGIPAGPARERAQAGLDLLAAASAGDLDEVRRLLDTGLDVNGTYGRLGATLLNHITAPPPAGQTTGDVEPRILATQRALLELGADPTVFETGVMRVHAGFREAVFNYPNALGQLIDHMRSQGPEALQSWLDAQGTMNGYTKLIDAVLRGNPAIVGQLLDAGASTAPVAINGWDAHAAAERFNQQNPDRAFSPDVMARLRPSAG